MNSFQSHHPLFLSIKRNTPMRYSSRNPNFRKSVTTPEQKREKERNPLTPPALEILTQDYSRKDNERLSQLDRSIKTIPPTSPVPFSLTRSLFNHKQKEVTKTPLLRKSPSEALLKTLTIRQASHQGLRNLARNFKNGSDKSWEEFFAKNKSALIEAKSAQEFKVRLCLLIKKFCRSAIPSHPLPSTFLTFFEDLKETNLSTIKRIYFNDPATPSLFQPPFYKTIFDILNNDIEEIDMPFLFQEELTSLSKKILDRQLVAKAVKRDESLRLLIHLEQTQRETPWLSSSGIFVVKATRLYKFVTDLIKRPSRSPQRYQIIVRGQMHYLTLDLEIHNKTINCLVIDSANSGRWMLPGASLRKPFILNTLNRLGLNRIYYPLMPLFEGEETRTLQSDGYNCATMSLNFAFALADSPDIFKTLTEQAEHRSKNLYSIPAFSLPPQIIENAQSTMVLRAYQKENAELCSQPYKGSPSFAQYIREYLRAVPLRGRRKVVNGLAHQTFFNNKLKIREAIHRLPPITLSEIVYPSFISLEDSNASPPGNLLRSSFPLLSKSDHRDSCD